VFIKKVLALFVEHLQAKRHSEKLQNLFYNDLIHIKANHEAGNAAVTGQAVTPPVTS